MNIYLSLIVADGFENFRKRYLEIYQPGPAFLFAPVLAWPSALKKNDVKLELPADINMLLIVKKGVLLMDK